MSRCFPFPPPGYERKHRYEDLDLLKEAKCKEKKHKKEKKVKERKKEKDKERDGSSEKHRDTKDQKEKHKEKKEKHRDKKDKEKYDEAKIKNENKKGSEQNKLKNEGSNNHGGFGGHKSTSVLNGSNSNAINDGNIKRRKDMCTNGFLHERENRPIKMQRPSPHQLTENGRKLKPPQTLAKPSNANQAILDKNNELVTVGMFEAQNLSASVPMPDAEASKLAQSDSKMAEVIILESLRRSASPHPDSNYLAEVQNVPKNMAEWCENDDDQLWLFSERVERKPELLHSFSDDVCVWSEAVHIKSADICALPYVIPY